MSSHFLTDKGLALESRFAGWALARAREFAEPGVEPNYAPDRGAAVVHIAVSLDIDPQARTLRGEARVRFGALAGEGDARTLHLDDLTVDAVTSPSGEALVWRHRDGALVVPAVDEVVVRYHGRPRRGLWFVGPTAAEPHRGFEAWTQCQDEDARFVFPCVDAPGVKHPFSIRVRAPEGYTVVSNGRLVGRDGEVWVWEQAEPMSPYLFSVVVARLDSHAGASAAGVPLAFHVPAGTERSTVARVFGRTAAMVDFLSGLYGAYPWPRYDQVVVHDFIFGGMENVAATTLTDLVLTDPRAAIDFDSDDLIVHELAHQWFGDLLTCQDWSQAWLNEGWATWTEHLWAAHHLGQDEADWHLWEHLGNYLGEDGGRYRRPIVSYRFKAPIDLFDRHLYEKGALVLHTLRATLGDTAFWAGVRTYLERHRFGAVHTRHFQRALEDATGRTLDRFFNEWVYGAGHPTLEVTVSHADGALNVTVKQTQDGEGVAKAFAFPLTIGFGDEERTLRIDARERTWSLPCAVAPATVRVDSAFRALTELTLKAPRSMLVAALRGDPGVIGRIRAAKALAADPHPEALAALVSALRSDPFWGVRAEVADLLAARAGDEAVAALASALTDAHPKARRRVVAALGNTRSPAAIAALSAITEVDPSVQVEGELVRALCRLRAPEARARAEALLGRESWGEVLRARAVEGLGMLRDAEVLPVLLDHTSERVHPRVVTAACAALARLGDEVDAVRLPVVERLCVLATSDSFRVCIAALNALGALRDPRALPVLTRVHASASDGRSRRIAYEAAAKVREGRTSAEGLGAVRREVESLVEENRKLRARIEKVEAGRGT